MESYAMKSTTSQKVAYEGNPNLPIIYDSPARHSSPQKYSPSSRILYDPKNNHNQPDPTVVIHPPGSVYQNYSAPTTHVYESKFVN